MVFHLNQSAVGLWHFFTLKIASEALGTKKGEINIKRFLYFTQVGNAAFRARS